jgi:hypothetical protein
MLADLTALLSAAPKTAKREEFNRLIVEENVLGKRTTSNRWLTARHLADLYGIDPTVTVFRLLRMFWTTDAPARPMLALLCALARDALLRSSAPLVLGTKPGESLTSGDLINHFESESPGRFSESMIRSLSQTWPRPGRRQGSSGARSTKSASGPWSHPQLRHIPWRWVTCAGCMARCSWKVTGRGSWTYPATR